MKVGSFMLGSFVGICLGMATAFVSIKYGGHGLASDRCPGVATPATECVDRMNAAARECDKSGLVDFERTDRDEIGNASKRLVCKRQTQTEIKP